MKKSKKKAFEFHCEMCEKPAIFSLHLGRFMCAEHGKTRAQIFEEANRMMNSGMKGNPFRRFNEEEEDEEEEDNEVKEKRVCSKCGCSVFSFKAKTAKGGICSSCYTKGN